MINRKSQCLRRKPKSATAILVLGLIVLLSGCSEPETSTRTIPETNDPVLRQRIARDAAFKSVTDSPLLEPDKAAFKGLSYYSLAPGLRFSVPLHRYPSPKQVRLATNTGEIRSGLCYGYFEFKVEEQVCRLQVYRLEDAPGSGGAYLFIPFRDSTSGNETYSAGRYLDLKENTSGIYDLDFNRAYNPSCAYNSEFSCPVPPAENTLSVPIRAGEMKFNSSRSH
jgi:uncharacterized protein